MRSFSWLRRNVGEKHGFTKRPPPRLRVEELESRVCPSASIALTPTLPTALGDAHDLESVAVGDFNGDDLADLAVADQVNATDRLTPSDQVAVALNCFVAPDVRDVLLGLMSSLETLAMLIVLPSFTVVPLAWAVAVYLPVLVPAVYRPEEVMLPPVADQVTDGVPVVPLEYFATALS